MQKILIGIFLIVLTYVLGAASRKKVEIDKLRLNLKCEIIE
jgi:hypothetical protein